MSFKQSSLIIYDYRNDLPFDDVRLHIQQAVSTLHAADAQYDFDWYNVFILNILPITTAV